MNCENCANPIHMRYETDSKGYLKGYYWCNVCNKQSRPKFESSESKESSSSDSELPTGSLDGFGMYDWMYDE